MTEASEQKKLVSLKNMHFLMHSICLSHPCPHSLTHSLNEYENKSIVFCYHIFKTENKKKLTLMIYYTYVSITIIEMIKIFVNIDI